MKAGRHYLCEWVLGSALLNPLGGPWALLSDFIVFKGWFYEDTPSLASEPIWSSPRFSSNFTAAHFIPSAASRKTSIKSREWEMPLLWHLPLLLPKTCEHTHTIYITYYTHTHTHGPHSTYTHIHHVPHKHKHTPYISPTLHTHNTRTPHITSYLSRIPHRHVQSPCALHAPHTQETPAIAHPETSPGHQTCQDEWAKTGCWCNI